MKVGCLIRFKNSSATLPAVLAGLARQTLQPDFILGVDNGSTDDSAGLLRAAGVRVVDWAERYSHPRVLNFGLGHCAGADLVLVLSSHTELQAADTVERMVGEFASDPALACVSAKWGADDYTDRICWQELQEKGLRLCSIYSNSMGMLRRSCWEEVHFDETLPTAEDYDWSLSQLQRGRVCGRMEFPFAYQRQGYSRTYEFTHTAFRIAQKHGLRIRWLGAKGTLSALLRGGAGQRQEHWQKLKAWAVASFVFRFPLPVFRGVGR